MTFHALFLFIFNAFHKLIKVSLQFYTHNRQQYSILLK